ncbi:MAG: hypothetical protein JNL81_14390 [Hyphomonadaceae bacterium]|nr:hypothetical protein [Hyphomonadaceae bacterium]
MDAPESKSDPIEPVSIVHRIDDDRDVDPAAFYNFLDYVFERDGMRVIARAYLDEMGWVTFMTEGPAANDAEGQLRIDAAIYLARRYEQVTFLHERNPQ